MILIAIDLPIKFNYSIRKLRCYTSTNIWTRKDFLTNRKSIIIIDKCIIWIQWISSGYQINYPVIDESIFSGNLTYFKNNDWKLIVLSKCAASEPETKLFHEWIALNNQTISDSKWNAVEEWKAAHDGNGSLWQQKLWRCSFEPMQRMICNSYS